MRVTTTTVNLRDPQGRRIKSLESIHAIGDWQFIQLGHYTSASPWEINQGNTDKLTFQESDITYIAGNGLEVNYDYTDQLFRPQQLNDLYFSEIRFKAKCSKQNGYADVTIDVPTFTFNPLQGETFGIPKGASVEQFISLDGGIFIGQEVIDNGFEINFTAGDGNFEIYDISILSSRIGSGLD
ncbi:conserved hypothetical protein [Vibrio phage 501E54-1]|nr:conserved hypothetical protein [Vibrio phage 501E54-1]